MSKFYVVATPIGNLEDMTFRAISTLKSVDLILCEDTRVTRKLLSHYGISTSTLSYHTHSKISKIDAVIKFLEEGKNLALVSDAGTPSISDPGSYLVSEIRAKLPEVEMIVIPGPSALISALSVSGLPFSDFVFLGFLPHKKGRETLFKEIAEQTRTVAFYESPHRIEKTLISLREHFEKAGCLDRKIVISRELTKIFEQTISGTVSEIITYFTIHPDKIRGEFVVMVAPKN